MKTILAAFTFVFCLSLGAMAQERAMSMDELTRSQVAKVMEVIDLDENQETLLFRQMYTQNENLRRLDNMKAVDGDKAAMAEAQTKRYHEAVKQILTEEQYESFLKVTEAEAKKAAKAAKKDK